jgi:predicted RNase H-like HicB family nuclease
MANVLEYAVVVEPDDGVYSIIVPALPEVHTFGATNEEALRMASEAIALALDYRRDNGLDIPPNDAGRAIPTGLFGSILNDAGIPVEELSKLL